VISKYSKLASLSVAAALMLAAVPACSKDEPAKKTDTKSGAGTSTVQATGEAPTASAPAAGQTETVVFEVTGDGKATTIDLVPAGNPERLYDVPLPWTSTISIGPDVTQLQIVVVGSTATNPGCKITLDGKVVAEKPVGGDAHCVFDR